MPMRLLRLSNNAGISIGPSLGGLLTVLSYSFAFFFAAFGMIAYGLLLAFLAVETLPHKTTVPKYSANLSRLPASAS